MKDVELVPMEICASAGGAVFQGDCGLSSDRIDRFAVICSTGASRLTVLDTSSPQSDVGREDALLLTRPNTNEVLGNSEMGNSRLAEGFGSDAQTDMEHRRPASIIQQFPIYQMESNCPAGSTDFTMSGQVSSEVTDCSSGGCQSEEMRLPAVCCSSTVSDPLVEKLRLIEHPDIVSRDVSSKISHCILEELSMKETMSSCMECSKHPAPHNVTMLPMETIVSQDSAVTNVQDEDSIGLFGCFPVGVGSEHNVSSSICGSVQREGSELMQNAGCLIRPVNPLTEQHCLGIGVGQHVLSDTESPSIILDGCATLSASHGSECSNGDPVVLTEISNVLLESLDDAVFGCNGEELKDSPEQSLSDECSITKTPVGDTTNNSVAEVSCTVKRGWKRRPRVPSIPDERPPSIDRVPALEAAFRGFANRKTEVVVEPALGTVFDSLTEAYEFYNLYSWEYGFGIRYGKSRQNTCADNRRRVVHGKSHRSRGGLTDNGHDFRNETCLRRQGTWCA